MKIHWIRFRVNYFLPVNTGQNSPILKWQSTLAKWCYTACYVSLCEAVGLWLISAPAHSWWGQTTFFSHLERNKGARNCAGRQTETAPRAALNQGHWPVSVFLFVFFPFFVTLKKSCVDLPRYHWGLNCSYYYGNWAVISTGHHKNSSSDFGWGIVSPLAHFS